MTRFCLLGAASLVAGLVASSADATEYLSAGSPGGRAPERSYSPAVITEGGRIVWVAGTGGSRAADGKPIADFAGQVRQAFRNIETTVKRAGGTLQDVVTMTVFIRNQSDGDEFVKLRGEIFKSKYPASALITVKDFANPGILVEIQSVAVVGATN